MIMHVLPLTDSQRMYWAERSDNLTAIRLAMRLAASENRGADYARLKAAAKRLTD